MTPKLVDLDPARVATLIDIARDRPLTAEEHAELRAVLPALQSLGWVTQELQRNRTSIRRLKRIIFGASTEKTRNVFGDKSDGAAPDGAAPDAAAPDAAAPDAPATGSNSSAGAGPAASQGGGKANQPRKRKRKRKGHGRNGANDYPGAERQHVDHESLKPGERCPACGKGKVYPLPKPAVLVRITGQAPLPARVITCQRLRCNACGRVFTARAPPDTPEDKYDETAAAMIALLKYGTGLPFHRLARLQQGLGIPLPPATQWLVVSAAYERIAPAHRELIRQAAQGQVVYNDDTPAIILQLVGKRREQALREQGESDERTGLFTSGIVATRDGVRIAVFFTGKKHAGENLADVLAQRAADLGPPIQMCDALSRNVPASIVTTLANCNSHGRRQFVDVANNFPAECRRVLNTLRKVYRNEATAKKRKMSADERLALHQARSGPPMVKLKAWMQKQLAEHRVEPNSGLGDAFAYMIKHWNELTLFLRVPGAPLDNNICERALKKAILHRKNALFYKTENGAAVGDAFMSLIHTAELCGVGPMDYLVALLRHAGEVARCPEQWMPWNYRQTLAGAADAA